MWVKLLTRRVSVQLAQAWIAGIGAASKRTYGIALTRTLVFRDAKKTDYYVDAEEEARYIRGLYAHLKRETFLKQFHRQARHDLEFILRDVKRKLPRDYTKISNTQLLSLYTNVVLPSVEQFYVRMWTVFRIADPCADVLRQAIEKRVANTQQAATMLLTIAASRTPNDVLRERMDLLQLVLQKMSRTSHAWLRMVDAHARRYAHIPMFDYDHEPYAREHFIHELRLIRNPRRELNKLKHQFVVHERALRAAIRALQPDHALRLLINFVQENVFLRDYRDMIRQKLNFVLRGFYQELGIRLGLTIPLVTTLTNTEIAEYCRNGKPFSQKRAQEGIRAYLLIERDKKTQLLRGTRAMRKARQILRGAKSNATELHGIVGTPGKATGRAVIVYTNRDLPRVRRGDVLIATMTRQDYVPAMRMASAIVTDEGGVTCHAAIIARELGIPCIVGAQHATQVLKTGDRVEVDAINGIVRKLL